MGEQTRVSVEATVRDFLTTQLHKSGGDLAADESLLESGTIDSMGVLQLVAFLEATYGVKVGDDDLVPENFDTIAAISAFVERCQAATRD